MTPILILNDLHCRVLPLELNSGSATDWNHGGSVSGCSLKGGKNSGSLDIVAMGLLFLWEEAQELVEIAPNG